MEMSAKTICQFSKFGHCRFSVNCRLLHVKEICESESCETSKCPKRHPKACKFYAEYRRCKFGDYCSYSHDIKELFKEDTELRLETLEKDVKNKDAVALLSVCLKHPTLDNETARAERK